MSKLIKGHNFVKLMTPQYLKLHAHLQNIAKHSAFYQISPIVDVEGVIWTASKST